MSFNSQAFSIDSLENRKLLAAGALDPSFSGGQFVGDMALPPQIDYAGMRGSDFVRLSDGSVVVGGNLHRNRFDGFLGLSKFKPDGSIDRNFGVNGIVFSGIPTDYYEGAGAVVAADAAGRLLIADVIEDGSGTNLVVQSFTADGAPDTTIGDDGSISVQLNASGGSVYDMLVDSAGRIVLCGDFIRYNPIFNQLSFVARLLPTLAFDESFSSDGIAVIDASSRDESLQRVRISGDNKIVAVGTVEESSGRHILVTRLGETGELDRTFDGNGLAAVDGVVANSLSIDNTGQVVVAGWDSFATGSVTLPVATTIALRRLQSDGTLDPTFGGTLQEMDINGGLSKLPPQSLSQHQLALQPLANGGYGMAALETEYRFTLSGRPDRSFDGDGKRALATDLPLSGSLSFFRTGFAFEPSGSLLKFHAPRYDEYSGFPAFDVHRFVGGRRASDYNATLFLATTEVEGAVVLSDGRLVLSSRLATGHELRAFTRVGSADNSWGDRSRNFLYDGPNIFNQPDLIPNVDGGFYYSLGENDQSDGDGIAGGISYIDQNGRFVFRDVNSQEFDETSDRFELLPGGYLFHQNYRYFDNLDNSIVITPSGTFVTRGLPDLYEDEDPYAKAFTAKVVNVGRTGKTFAAGWQRLPGGSDMRKVLFRYDSSCVVDKSFDVDGFKVIAREFELKFAQSNGKALYSLQDETGLRRLQPNGATDNNFGKNGVAAVGFDSFTLDSQNRIIASRTLRGGAADGDVQVMRLTANGKIDTTFGGGDGIVVIDTKMPSTAKQNLLVTPQNKIVVTSVQLSETRVKWSAMRLLAE